MTRRGEFAIAGLLAVALHLAAFAGLAGNAEPGVESAGDGGVELVSLTASDAALAEMIRQWETPPDLASTTPPPPAPPATDPAPQIAADATPAPQALPMALALPQPSPSDTAPKGEAPPPPPPPEPKPEPQPDPKPDPQPKPKPEPKPEPAAKPAAPAPSPAQPAQSAAGQGGAQAAGQDGQARAATASGDAARNLRAEWGAEIRARIERRKSYPRDAGGASGTVKLRITVGTDGRLAAVGVLASSGQPALDAAAVKAVQRAGRFPRAPRALGAGQADFTLSISFKP
ncbi:MAG: energy transducer TonB [Paracoccaceae bacterium]